MINPAAEVPKKTLEAHINSADMKTIGKFLQQATVKPYGRLYTFLHCRNSHSAKLSLPGYEGHVTTEQVTHRVYRILTQALQPLEQKLSELHTAPSHSFEAKFQKDYWELKATKDELDTLRDSLGKNFGDKYHLLKPFISEDNFHLRWADARFVKVFDRIVELGGF